jgi:very-short-patch-repair endonuclease
MNVPWRGYVLDAVWWDLGVVVEIDDWDSHGTREAFRNDRRRDRELLAAGLPVIRLTADDLTHDEVAAALGTSLRRP